MNKIIIFSFSMSLLTFFFCCQKTDEKPEDKPEEIIDTLTTPYNLSISSIVSAGDTLWVGTSSNGLYKFVDNSWKHYSQIDGMISDTITSLAFDNNGNLWVGTNMGLSRFHNEIWTNYTTDNGLYSLNIYSLSKDIHHGVLIGMRNNRITRFDGENFTTIHVNANNVNSGHIHALNCDTNGNIWAGSCYSGLSIFDGKDWTHYVNELSVFVRSIYVANRGEIWVGHFTGAYRYSNNNWTHYSSETGLAGDNVFCFTEDHLNNIWIGTDQGLSKFDGTNWTTYTTESGLFDNNIADIAYDNNGRVWVGSWKGLNHIAVE